MISETINQNVAKTNTWKRILFMLMFAVIVGFVRILLWAIVLFQVAGVLMTGETNPNAQHFGKSLSVYLYEILLFLTFNSETMPFPFSDWSNSDNHPEIAKNHLGSK